MSLEAGITELNTNIKALIAALGSKPAFNVEKATADAKAASKAAQDARPAKTIITPTKPEAPAAQQGQSTAEGHAQPAAEALTYEKDIKPKALDFAKVKGNDALRALVAEMGYAKLTDAKPESYAGIVAAIDKALAA